MNHFLKIIVLGLVLAFNYSVHSAELDFNQLKKKLSQELVAENYKNALSTMKGIRALDVDVPNSFDFFEAKALFETGNKVEAYTLFKTYIDNAGRSGKYFKTAIQYLLKAESAYKKDQNKIIVIDDVMYQNQQFKAQFHWEDARNYCKNLELEGKGWQLPNKEQLEKLLTKQEIQGLKSKFHIRKEFVDNLESYGRFWTLTENEDEADQEFIFNPEGSEGYWSLREEDYEEAWGVFFDSGNSGWFRITSGNKLYAMCIKTEEGNRKAIAELLIEEKKVKHLVSIVGNYMWQDELYTNEEISASLDRQSLGKTQDWKGAISYCDNLELGGFNDWTLPSKENLLDQSKLLNGLELINEIPPYLIYWSNTTDTTKDLSAFVVTGTYVSHRKKSHTFPVRCFRSMK